MSTNVLLWVILLFLPDLQAAHKHIVCISLPKCGMHLFKKTISKLGIPNLYAAYESPRLLLPTPHEQDLLTRLNRYDPPNHYKGLLYPPTVGPVQPSLLRGLSLSGRRLLLSHWPYTPEAEALLDQRADANFLIIRDPRAMLVSMAHMVTTSRDGQQAPVEALMWDFIDGRQKHFIRWGVAIHNAYPVLWELGVVRFYRLYLRWQQAKNFMTVRFEDLVGSAGGGSEAVQAATIAAIAKHVGAHVSKEKIQEVQQELFGGTATFREGSIDGWKKYFTPAMKEAFKQAPGANELLIELGYEKNASW
ncbi:hypothetical protein EBZ39_06065 [bacterium]|nr:hypothetical protein [bacterium]